MYLKKIEVQGFKSFANKIVFDFHQGITGIVGPNGSGKSNVSDAVRWVLGEQSAKQLRGGNMQDVIFSGTELRKPQGFAAVSITMDNSDQSLPIDFPEVTISRRLYRSGESEYMINGSPCRLKDISELLDDTGIGQDGYSIIGQGQVDKILSKKSEDRRELFDEAAGITKYKKRKALAQKKLENERASLLRINDILAELEKQVGPLEKQSEKAKEYLKHRESLKKYEIHHFIFESGRLRERLEEFSKTQSILQEQLEKTNADSKRLKESYAKLENLVKEEEEEIEGLREEISLSHIGIREHEGSIGILKEQIHSEKTREEHILSRIKSIEKECSSKESRLEEQQKKLAASEQEHKTALISGEEAEKKLIYADESIMLLDRKIEEAKSGIINTIHEKAELSSKGQRVETLMEQIRIRKSEISGKLLQIKSEESSLVKKYGEEKTKLEDLEEKISGLDGQIQSAEFALKEEEKNASGIAKNISELENHYRRASARLESMKNIAERYDGYGNSIKKIMETRDRVRGIHGVLADLLTMEKEYETAIETALGGRIQNIVTDSEETAKILIEYLKKNKFGRATFLPLSAIKNKKTSSSEALLSEKGVIGTAASLIKTEERYRDLFDSLLGRIYVVDHIDHAVAIAKKHHYEHRLVTIEGESLSPGGSISGGAFKNSGNLLGRKREIEELEEELNICLQKNEELRREEKKILEELGILKTNLAGYRESRQEALIERSALGFQVASFADKIEELKDASTDFLNEKIRLDQEVEELLSEKGEVSSEISRLETKNSDIEVFVAEQIKDLEEEKKQREDLAAELEAARLKIASIEQSLRFTKETLKELEGEADSLREERKELLTGIGSGKRAVEEKEEEIRKKTQEILSFNAAIENMQLRLEEKSREKEQKSLQMKRIFEESDALSKEEAGLDKEHYRISGQKEKAQERLSSLSSYMWTEYELSYQSAKALEESSFPKDTDFGKQIEELKKCIRELGNVNVNAIEDYKEVHERYELMRTQYEDISDSEKELLKIIEELDLGMKKQFEEQFAHICREFDQVFKELFGGGSGRIELDSDADILEAGIHIIAQPPGKKLQNMMQLSGGEKALTAISLLFAIQNLKPSPFALLDEIEAALDDSNVDRFAKYLHKLCDRTQFIVITHRRGTMVSSDRLYGITMKEKGVSTLVSVNLIEDKLDQ
ncbi:MAG: chromosome segregation protein SMC [Johnsonella sp.]|nr:chromosome segregation protein SMC [Johnsonella sp.]